MFKIPKHYFAKISIFSTAFSLPPSEAGVEGLTEENPLVLHQISKVDFKAFLSILVPLYVNSTPLFFHKYYISPRLGCPSRQVPPNYSKYSVATWKSTLKLSTMWEVTALRDLAIKNLNKLDAIEMILFGTEYRVSHWFINGCYRLIVRKTGPTEKECDLLGINTAVQIYGLRERWLSEAHRISRIGKGPGMSECQDFVTKIVRETFSDRIFDEPKTLK